MVLHLRFLLLIISRGHQLDPQVYRCLYFSCYGVKAINIAESNVLEHLGLKATKKLNALKEIHATANLKIENNIFKATF